MSTLVLGPTGATGKQLVSLLLSRGHKVKVIVRPTGKIPGEWMNSDKITIIKANVSEMSAEEMFSCLSDCESVASCLGHNITFKGLFGKPRKLVTNAVKLICTTIERKAPDTPIRFVLMNTTGNRNQDLNEHLATREKMVLGLIRFLLPPHSDNENAAEFLRSSVGQTNKFIQWVAVRPDTLINEDHVTDYEVHPSPTRSAIFDPGKTSRNNVGDFMARLIEEDDLWNKWKGQMPVIYNRTETSQKAVTSVTSSKPVVNIGR